MFFNQKLPSEDFLVRFAVAREIGGENGKEELFPTGIKPSRFESRCASESDVNPSIVEGAEEVENAMNVWAHCVVFQRKLRSCQP